MPTSVPRKSEKKLRRSEDTSCGLVSVEYVDLERHAGKTMDRKRIPIWRVENIRSEALKRTVSQEVMM